MRETLDGHAAVKALCDAYELTPCLEGKLSGMERLSRAAREAKSRGKNGASESFEESRAIAAMFRDAGRQKRPSEEIANILLGLAVRERLAEAASGGFRGAAALMRINRHLGLQQHLYGWVMSAWEAGDDEEAARRMVEPGILISCLMRAKAYVRITAGGTRGSAGWLPAYRLLAEGIDGGRPAEAGLLSGIAAFASSQAMDAIKAYRERVKREGRQVLPELLNIYTYIERDGRGALWGWTMASAEGPEHMPAAIPAECPLMKRV